MSIIAKLISAVIRPIAAEFWCQYFKALAKPKEYWVESHDNVPEDFKARVDDITDRFDSFRMHKKD